MEIRAGGTTASVIIGFIGTLASAYLFAIGKLNERNLFWIIIGLIFFSGIMVYQDIIKELEEQRWEQKRLDEKFKIYERLSKIEEVLKI
ncbi:MAG: hypothetical protein ABIF88_01430 [archaeon]